MSDTLDKSLGRLYIMSPRQSEEEEKKMADKTPRPSSMTLEDTEAVARFAKALDDLAKAEGHWLDGKIRVWSPHGWSPGYFEFEDEWVMFYAEYMEAP